MFILKNSLKQLLTGAEVLDINQFNTSVKKDCQPFLTEVKNTYSKGLFLYRGMSDKESFIKKEVRPSRPPTHTPIALDTIMNEVLTKKKLPLRSNSTFTTPDPDIAEGYGNVFIIFPIGNYIYSADGRVSQLNSDFSDRFSVYGNHVPKSFNQMLSGDAAGFGQLSAVEIGLRDSFFVADTDNDRVVEIDKTGKVLWGLKQCSVM